MMKPINLLRLPALIVLVTACSNRQMYEAVQQNRQSECAKLPPSQYEECVESYSGSYEDYKKERESVLND